MDDRFSDTGGWVADCLVRAATDVLRHQWDGVVLVALGGGPRRRSELREAIGPIKDKPLSEAIARLMASNLIVRHRAGQTSSAPVYELTALGRTFYEGPLSALAVWAQNHGDRLLDTPRRR